MTVMTRKTAAHAPLPATRDSLIRRYHALLSGDERGTRQWLAALLAQVSVEADDLPATPDQLDAWSAAHATAVAQAHAQYLEQRRQGGPRRYFANRSQALWFLQQVAPTKAVDGAWLHASLRHWQDPRFHGLIRTYLEELGEGDPRCNHVLIYQRLLSRLGCLETPALDDQRYLQGAVQLALGCCGDDFLPEVIGYNLGYEQPPLHLLITTHELAELGIDGHYFQLHVTIDNAAIGHASKAIRAVQQLCPAHDPEVFYRRVRHGYRLNDLGLDTPSLIGRFDLDAELLAALERKRAFGQFMHADRCRVQQRTVNQWLAEPGALPAFLQALQSQGWIRRGQNPSDSRWWSLIDGPHAPMFGVFSAYEKQLWHDWIAADWQQPIRPVLPGSWQAAPMPGYEGEASEACMDTLITRMAGNRHALPEGLQATRAYLRATGLAQEGPH
ncbi:iron-containing redox enzyme family protein [Pseudomonas sp. CC120222-01a]|uniref:iron-containing redox enzyme family protein n=1 Tax=Pseudomonas sp. CC120222-01a TaxID=1378075 RepID=UPI000D9698DB|nr:iron-containing redox enzyme family protein [Pseudomonas sp. CC120222-01a]PVZ40931.1 heme oxygenase-like protein [Pseudomonas sp. CC120222-01a]